MSYHLVHILDSWQFKKPLIASQVFDRAEAEATVPGTEMPLSVSVWVIAPMRDVFDKEAKEIFNGYQKRCPSLKIKIIFGISRLNNWPILATLKKLRRRLAGPTVYHCRGEVSLHWAVNVRKAFKGDAVVFDARGFWPLERLILDNLTEEHTMNATQKAQFDNDMKRLVDGIAVSDWVCTVSEPLKQLLISRAGAREDTVVVPCCVNEVIPHTHRLKIRKELDIENKTAILYLGGTQIYQYVESLAIPFIKSALSQSDKYVGVFITQDKEKMQGLLAKADVPPGRTRLISVPQDKVAEYLTAIDIGLLLRGPTAVNEIAQPVKFGEYLSAGMPVVVEEGTGDIAALLHGRGLGCVIRLTGKTEGPEFDREVAKALDWYAANSNAVKENTTRFVEEQYTWKANVPAERKMYTLALAGAGAKTNGQQTT